MGNVVCALGSLYFRSGCSASAVASMLAFHPPRPPSYSFKLDPSTKKFTLNLSPLLQEIIDAYGDKLPPLSLALVPTKRRQSVALILIEKPRSKHVLLYSHGNAADMGLLLPRMVAMSEALQTSLVYYDYTGYGASSGSQATEKGTYSDIEAVYTWVCEKLSFDPNTQMILKGQSVGKSSKCSSTLHIQLVLIGQSIGSGPSTYLATKRPVAGLIIESGITSGISVLMPNSRMLRCVDIFPNIDRIKHVKCPVLIIHGAEDEEVPFSHGQQLQENVPDQYKHPPWFLEGYGHNDIGEDDYSRYEYLKHLRDFMEAIDRRRRKSSRGGEVLLIPTASAARRGSTATKEGGNAGRNGGGRGGQEGDERSATF